ncbi:MAG TPA: hypothetical protein DD412_00265 [Holosporales bacterium]|nr:hypothetical protein [Holosporales bacterium]
MDTWNYFNILGVPASIIALYVFLYGTPKKRLIEILKYKLSIEKHEKRLKFILRNYKTKKHLVQNPHLRTATMILDNIRIIPITLFFIAIVNYAAYDLYTSFSKIFEHYVTPHEIIFIGMMITLFSSMVFIKLPFGNIAPLYHFKTFHEQTVCEIYNTLKKVKNTPDLTKDEIESIHKIAQTCLEDEFPENELTDLGLASHFTTYNYPKVVEKEMKKKNYNFETDKVALVGLTERLLEKYKDNSTTPHAA